MNLNEFCLRLITEFPISDLRKHSNYTGGRPGRIAWLRYLGVGISIAAGMFVGTNALAATYRVTTTADSNDGSCGSTCSLRDAITAANGSAGNTINFTGLSGTITLASTLPAIARSMTIAGPGASTLTISGNNAYQILDISSGTVTISGLTFVNGSSALATNGGGGAINSAGVLTVTNTTFSANTNAAIANSGPLTVTNSAFSGNSGDYGGAISSYGAMTVVNCTFSVNTAVNGGGAINSNVTLNVINSTFSGNSTTDALAANGAYGGGAILSFGTNLTVSNSTFSGNSTAAWGGAIYAYGSFSPTLTANNNIFIGNTVSNSYGGAGITAFVGTSNASYNLFYQNLEANGTEVDCDSCTSNTNAITGSNPNLLPLGYYGGPTETMLPQPGSSAICAGNYADVPNGVTTDQRGFPLTSSTCSNGSVDVGAVQSDYVQVTNTNDSGTGSLRAAITAANATSYGGDIDFASAVTGTITLASALPTISESMVIMGPGAGNLTISGKNAHQILIISSGSVTISGLTLANGNNTTGDGGAIENSGALTVTNSSFSGNSALDFGGAIENSVTLIVTDSTFSGNYASSNGGAISSTGTLTVTNSTFSGNSGGYEAAGGAGAIFNSGTLTVISSTFSGNSGNYGGAIYNYGSSVTADNNIFTGNSSQYGSGAGILDDSSTTNASYNLYYQNLDAGTTEDDCKKCFTNTNAITDSNPLLSVIGSYGGPTAVMLPQPGSPAICAGFPGLIPSSMTMDQRGFSRTTTYSGTSCVDLGAVQTDYTAVAFSTSSYSGVANQTVNPAPMVTVTENGQNIGGVPITLTYSGTGSPVGLGPVTTLGGAGATFSSLTASSAAPGTLSVNLPITASGNPVQPADLSASASLNIQLATQIITFVAPSSLTYGSDTTLSATGGASGNPVTFSLDSTTTLGVATLNGSTLTITGVGTVVIDANQAAGGGYSAATQVQQSTVVNPASLSITASSPTVTYGSAAPTITPIFGTFFNGDTSAVLTKQPTCVTAYTTTSAAGSSPSTSCSGAAAANYTFTYVNGSVTVNKAAATITITPSSSSITTAQALTITVAVSGGAANVPSGSVTLTSGGYSSGAVTLSSGNAIISIPAGSLAAGSDTLTVSYTPDTASSADYNSASGTSSVSVTFPPTFVVGGGSASISIVPGATTGNTVSITVTPSNGFTGTVNLTCSISPLAASEPPTCSLLPASVTISGTGAQTSTLTISTTASTMGENQLKRLLWPSTGTALALVLMIGIPCRRRGWVTVLGVLALSIGVGAIGCGGGGGGKSGGIAGTTAGTYTITVTGTSGSVTGTVGTITLTVQ